MTDIYTKNKTLTLIATVIPQPNITITIYEWKVDTTINSNKTNTLIIKTNDLSLGIHDISLRVLNSCGTWSKYVIKQIEIINEVNQMSIISNMIVASNKAYIKNTLVVGQKFYIDRTYTVSNVPAIYNGLEYIITATDDRYSTLNNFLSFDISQDAIVYVVYNDNITPKPSWLSSFVDTGDNITRSDSKIFSVYSKQYKTGKVSLDGCSIPSGGAGGMYIVIVKPSEITPPSTDYIIDMTINSTPPGAKLHISGNVIIS